MHCKLPPGKRGQEFWEQRFDDINRFERHLERNGTLVLKFFLHLSKKEQKRRFLERLDNPEKNWKFSLADLKERDLLGRVPGRVPGHAPAHQHEMGAVVGDSRRPQMGDACAGLGRDRAADRGPWPEAAGYHAGAAAGAGRSQADS